MKEASMRVAVAGIAIVVLIVVGFAVNAALISTPPADAETVTGSIPKGISVYAIHVNHPNMKGLPVQEIRDPF